MNSHITNLSVYTCCKSFATRERHHWKPNVGSISARVSRHIFPGGEHNNAAVPSLYMVRTRRVLVDSEWMCHSGNNHKQLHKWLILHVTFPHFHSNNTDIVRSFLPLFRCLICYVGEQHSSVLDRSNFKLEPNWFNRGRSAAVSFSHPCNKT